MIFGVLVGSMSLGHAMPSLEALTEARGAAHAIFETIDRVGLDNMRVCLLVNVCL